MEYIALGISTQRALSISGLTRHQYYYKPKLGNKRPGAKPSKTTNCIVNGSSEEHNNTKVVDHIIINQKDPDLHYGYQRMTTALKILGYLINHKKVYRLMEEHNLLQVKKKRTSKKHVQYRILIPSGPLEGLEMDIKFIWIESESRHGYILSIIDVFTRVVLAWHVGMSITQQTVKEIWTRVIENHLQENDMLNSGISIEIRNDNDPRFSAKSVQQFFADNYLNQVFTHPYTPQENGHIESFHAILGRSLDRRHFETLLQVEAHLHEFYYKYNNIRLHGSIANLAPFTFWNQWKKGNITRTVKEKKKVKFKLNIPYHRLSGNENLEGASCLNQTTLDGMIDLQNEVVSADKLLQPSVQRSPSVASC